MNKENFDNIICDAINDSDLKISDIPSIDLYLEQIINLIQDKNDLGSPRFSDRVPTKTMVNNYSKAGLIAPIKGKTYNKEQIIQILLTNSLKNTLSIAEIKNIMAILSKSSDKISLEEVWDKYINIKNADKDIAPTAVSRLIEDNGFDKASSVDCLMVVMAMAAMADYFKCISKALLESLSDELGVTQSPEEENEPSEKELKKAAKRAEKAQKKAEKENVGAISEDYDDENRQESDRDPAN